MNAIRKTTARGLDKPCPTPYASEHFRGRHNVVGGYVAAGVYEPRRCVSCGAVER